MESGLEGRNNDDITITLVGAFPVSMESGLEGRNNSTCRHGISPANSESQWSPA